MSGNNTPAQASPTPFVLPEHILYAFGETREKASAIENLGRRAFGKEFPNKEEINEQATSEEESAEHKSKEL